MNLNSPPSHFPMHQITHENDHELYHLQDRSSSSSSLSCRFFFDPSQDHHTAFYDHHRQLYQQPDHVPDENYKVDHSGVGLGVWKKEDEHEHEGGNPMKWMSSKMRVMQKMKKTECHHDQKMQASSSDLSSNSSSYNNNNNNSPIRVCSDCNTTKTPLWRSGPKGPKSLCNACGIRQRKARRAMAAAAAAAAASSSDHSPTTTKIKLQHKGKLGKNGHASHFKKRCRTAVAATSGAASDGKKQLGFEDFLINLSNNLAFHRVFPDDVKDAAILLMALSSGLVNG